MPQSVLQRMAELSNKKSATPVAAPAEVSAPLTQEERKARTRRLIQIGALTDQYLRCAELTPEEVGELLKEIVSLSQVANLLQQQ